VNFILFVSSLSIVFIFCEVIIRLFFTFTTFKVISANGSDWNVDDSRRDYKLNPGFIGRVISSEFDHEIVINSEGFRDSKFSFHYSKSDTNRNNIFMIGDSFIFGVGVDYSNSIPARTEFYLQNNGVKISDVWNLGTPGYSIQQYIYTLENYMQYADPSTVVIGIYAGKLYSGADDIFGSADFELFEEKNNIKVDLINDKKTISNPKNEKQHFGRSKQISLIKMKKWFARNSALYNYVLVRVGPQLRAIKHGVATISELNKKKQERGWNILKSNLKHIKNLSNKHNFEVIIVFIPSNVDVINKYDVPGEKIREIVNVLRFEYLNGYELIKQQSLKKLYYPIDGHMTAEGYDIYGRAIADIIKHQ